MQAFKAYNQYKQNSVNTAQPEELVLMLYNGLIKFIMRGREAIISGNIEEANRSIVRAQEIVHEFLSTLDRSYEVSKGLEAMYEYMYRRLLEANVSKDLTILEEILGYAKEFRDTWEEAMKIAKRPGKANNEVNG